MFMFQMFRYFHGPYEVDGTFVLPVVFFLVLFIWPFLDRSPLASEGVWFAPARRRQNLLFTAIALGMIALILLSMYCRGPSWGFYWPWQPWPPTPSGL